MSSLMKTTATQENPIYNMDISVQDSPTPPKMESADEITDNPPLSDTPTVAIVVSASGNIQSDFVNYQRYPTGWEKPFLPSPEMIHVISRLFAVFFCVTTTGLADGAEEGVEEGNVPPTPLVDTFPAVDDAASLPAEGAFETVMEDVSLVDDETTSSSAQQSQTIASNNSNGGAAEAATIPTKHPLKRLWKRATKKFTMADHPAGVGSSSLPDAERTVEVSRFTAPTTQSQQPEDEMQLTLAEETDE